MEQPDVYDVFIIRVVGNCSSEFSTRSPKYRLSVHLTCFSFVALVLNSFSLIIFCLQRNKSIMRSSLILLSIAEICFHSSFMLSYLFKYAHSVFQISRYEEKIFFSISISLLTLSVDVSVSVRNWCNLAISASRAEAIACPLKTQKLFTKRRILLVLVGAGSVASGMSFLRYLDYEMVICQHPSLQTHVRPYLSNETKAVIENVYLSWQSGIPFFVVVTSTMVIILVLCAKSNVNLPNFNSQRRKNQNFAIRTVLSLAILFSLCELPNLIMTIFKFPIDKDTETIGNTMVLLDSIFNFLVYTFSLPYFRSHIKQLARCQRLRVPLHFQTTSRLSKNTLTQTNFIEHTPCLRSAKTSPKQLMITFETQI